MRAPQELYALVKREFLRVGGDHEEAPIFADMITSLIREAPAPRKGAKERRQHLLRLSLAMSKAADLLAQLDGIEVQAILGQAADYSGDTSVALGNHPDRIDGRFSFGRHGLSRTHVDALSREGNTSWQAMREMVHDLNLIAVAAQRSASGTLKNPGDHRRLLAKGIVDTMKVFGLKPTTTPEGIGAVLMRELLAARGDGGSGLQAFQEVVMHQGKNHTPDS